MPLHVLAVVVVIVVAKPIIAAGIALALKQTRTTSLMIGAGLGQIGEFSFILGTLGRSLGLLPDEAYQLIIAGAIISIALNPMVFWVMSRLDPAIPGERDQTPAIEGAAMLTPVLTAEGVASAGAHAAPAPGRSQLPRAS
jgi:CPA2 family monovalent cation:H+ antiporter-2